MSSNNRCPRKEHIDLVLLDGRDIFYSMGIFPNALAFASQDCLIDAKAVALDRQYSAICWDTVPHSDGNYISWNEFLGLDTL